MKPNFNTLLISAFILLWYFFGNKVQNTTTDHALEVERKTLYDSVKKEIVEHHIHHYKTDTLVLEKKDSGETYRDYFTQHFLEDSLRDSNISISWRGMIWKNSLFDPHLTYKILRPKTIIEPIDPHRKVFLGGAIDYKSDLVGFNVGLGYLDKKDNLFTLQYDLINKNSNKIPALQVGVYKKLKF